MAEHELQFEWVHLCYDEAVSFTETYGFAGNQGSVNLEGILIRPLGVTSRTLHIMMHPSATMQLLPVPRAAARRGAHVLCAGSRYAKNDSACILEKVLLDLGAFVAHAKKVWGYERIVLLGWSGGGSLALFYQSEAEHPSIVKTPAGDPVNVAGAALIPADAIIYQAAHISRARLLVDMIDPSVRNETDPDDRDVELDIYNSANPNQPPYTAPFIQRYREAQLGRIRRITAWSKDILTQLNERGGDDVERGFVVHRTLADPRFLDPSIDPNGRRPGWCYLGKPSVVNNGPVGLARFATLRAWLSQWSVDDTNADGLRCVKKVTVPLLVIENGADDAVPQPHTQAIFDCAASGDKTFVLMETATHYYTGQPAELAAVTKLTADWLGERGLGQI